MPSAGRHHASVVFSRGPVGMSAASLFRPSAAVLLALASPAQGVRSPTVDMEGVRPATDGFSLKFSNSKTIPVGRFTTTEQPYGSAEPFTQVMIRVKAAAELSATCKTSSRDWMDLPEAAANWGYAFCRGSANCIEPVLSETAHSAVKFAIDLCRPAGLSNELNDKPDKALAAVTN